MLKKQEDQKQDAMLSLAEEFKEKIAELNKAHKETIDAMNAYKSDKLADISKEFSLAVTQKEDIVIEYKDDIKQIVDKYDELIKEEKDKQSDLRYKIDLTNKAIKQGDANLKEKMANLQLKYLEDKAQLEKAHNDNLENENSEFKQEETALNKSIANINENIDFLNKKIDEVSKKYDVLSDEIEMKKFAIVSIFDGKMKEIDEYYNTLISDSSNKRKQVDVLNNDVAVVFKKS